ncbi:MAG: hypothetical protein D8M57_07615 [Candidatus Scalindua sp. AMX11]|nr:MAG: hypothetical protein DWQ00_05865 [Candidatus Scalindua sp.]NOG82525.1 hypothetical protein [Planctomycetota bacterium]RZV93955.1 MAG: hypothetical protein EX341_03625 [Candidatus Scalindua sp. SCAELEC01]TDE65575.1 MAG: hypothetical protein D8M57_07615 [Candidatus Scalindua sp. AMX11]GJQ58160.1 MAG: hypothetical protein SCALA701_09610 [Candidatus Scalindua sp.]
MKHPKHVGLFIALAFLGISIVGFCSRSYAAEEWEPGFEAFKPWNDPGYHQRNTGNIDWNSFEELPAEETKHGAPKHTDIYWIEGEKGWINRMREAEGRSRLKYQTPANLSADKYHSACPLCGFATYFWLDNGDMDSETIKTIQADYPSWKQADGACRYCFETYAVRSGAWYDGKLASSTDEYVIGYNKSKGVQDYFKQVK